MQSFGALLRELREPRPLTQMARQLGISKSFLANLEAGRKIPSEPRARSLLQRGFDLTETQIDACLMEVHLRDHGLEDPDLRRLVIAVAQGRAPQRVVRQLQRLAHRYGPQSWPGTDPAED